MIRKLLTIVGLCLFAGSVVAQGGPVDTGQDSCYNVVGSQISCPEPGQTLFGQDANYQGAAPSYRDNGDGTVTDLNTGLMWQQSPGSKVSWVDANANAASFNLGGHTDWRMPTITELYSLINFNGAEGRTEAESVPFLDTAYFEFEYGDLSIGERIIDAQYWSSTEYVSTTMNGNQTVFGVNFADGRIKGYERDTNMRRVVNTLFLLYVRGPAYGVNAFVDNGNGTITDQSSGLIWMQADSGASGAGPRGNGSLNWEEALAWCEGLSHAGFDDWRLPDAKELQGIVDYTRSPDTTNSAAIDPLFSITSITDGLGQTNYPFFWTGTTHRAGPSADHAVYLAFGEAQGYMEMPPNSGNVQLMDVHGAGAQRSDPKDGNPADYPTGHGPQGDVIGIYNYARCVRGGNMQIFTGGAVTSTGGGQQQQGGGGQQQPPDGGQQGQGPPQAAFDACNGLSAGATCTVNTPQGTLTGTCTAFQSQMACVPAGGPPSGG